MPETKKQNCVPTKSKHSKKEPYDPLMDRKVHLFIQLEKLGLTTEEMFRFAGTEAA